jgi:hypothetical protein
MDSDVCQVSLHQDAKKTQKRHAGMLVCYLCGMFMYVWAGFIIQMYLNSMIRALEPPLNALRIFVLHASLWYPVLMYYFFGLLKNVQFQRSSVVVKRKEKNQIANVLSIPLSPTIILKPTIQHTKMAE